MSDKIKPHHLERKAILYIRQSSAYQVTRQGETCAWRIVISPGTANVTSYIPPAVCYSFQKRS